MLVIGMAYAGQRTAHFSEESVQVTNLNAVSDSKTLIPLFEDLFVNESDRRFAAQGLFDFIRSARDAGDTLPNVGAILKARVTVNSIDRAGLVEYRERLRDARMHASQAEQSAPAVLPLFTATDLATLKPSLVVRTPETFWRLTLFWSALYFFSFWIVAVIWRLRTRRGDYLLLATAHLLTAIGFAVLLSRPDALRDTVLFARYAQGVVFGLAVFALVSFVDFRKAAFLTLSYVPLLGALLLSAVLIVFGDGPGNGSVKVNLGPVQPVEAIRLLLALFLAGYFARRWELLRQIDGNTVRNYHVPAWLHIPRLDYLLPVLGGVAASLVFFFLQKDLGPALFITCVFLAVYTVARNRVGMALIGLAFLFLGFYVGYALNVSATLAARVQMWLSPWDNAVRGGDQVAQSLWGLSAGGLFGTGFGLGDTRYLPAGHTDLILAAIGEELGFIGLLLITVVYAVIAARGFRIARAAASDYGFFLATTVTMFLIFPGLIMIAGSLGVIPLTGVVTPFLSYGGSAMLANFAGLGILAAVRGHASAKFSTTGNAPAAEPFFKPMRYLENGLSVAALSLLAILFNVQFVSADDYVVKPHLSLQADGGRRFQYNQRVLDLARLIPRGTIYDQSGLALATSSAAIAQQSREDYKKIGVSLDLSCKEPFERCYPLGGRTFHLLGDARRRTNWSATNTSYIERDVESSLRGFNDKATVVDVVDEGGKTTRTIRRDYRELVPLLRHRYQPEHSAWQTFLSRPRDITLTIDARLQARIAAILSRHAAKSKHGRAAAVVIDPDSGNLLSAVSYPFPDLSERTGAENENNNEPLLDRARYGLYPPGSTFKLVTAATALRRDIDLSRAKFTCTGLPDGRVGARIQGWGRVRDDVLDTHPHGTISMHDGIVRSCNAYFAQLAVHVGPQALLDTAVRLGISAAPSNSVKRLRETLPQAGYGQGYVVTSPLRMARVAAMVAGSGVFREVRLNSQSLEEPGKEALLTPEAAELLGQYLRDAVLDGTGRSLGSHEWRIAGKTGTAEIKGSPSHAWFVGFAPYGQAKKRIAFAVIIENAGYGGLAAAPVTGEIVSAAAALGLIEQ
jgi:cell division protein FtsW (lipid II flippase)/cell division protein FtsI/penicillin-binding protein 2